MRDASTRDVRELGREALRGYRLDDTWRHELATCLWASGVYEARLLATIAEAPDSITPQQALAWAQEIDSWDLLTRASPRCCG